MATIPTDKLKAAETALTQIERQIAGSFVYGLSALFHGGITIKDGAVVETNFLRYDGMEYVAVWNRFLDDAELIAVNENPWQLTLRDLGRAYFYPRPMQPRRVWTMMRARSDKQP